MKKEYIFLFILMAAIKLTPASATHGLIMWQSIMDKPKFARVALDSSYTHLTDTPVGLIHFYDTMDKIATWQEMIVENSAMKDTAWSIRNSMYAMSGGFLSWNDTSTRIATKYNINQATQAARDSAAAIRSFVYGYLLSYPRWLDTNTYIATKYNISQTAQAGRDTALALRTFVYSSLLAYPKWSDTSTRLSSIKRLMDTAFAIRASLYKYDTSNRILYYNSSGRINNTIKKWVGIITPSTATDQSINISSAGFTSVAHCKIDGFYNGNLIWVQPKTVSTTSITVDLYRPNTSLVTVLGLSVLGGVPFLSGNDLSNIRLHVEVTGY